MSIIKTALALFKAALKEEGLKIIDEALRPLAEKFIQMFLDLLNGPSEPPENAKVYEEDVLSKNRLVEIAKECIVPNSNEVVAMKQNSENLGCVIYLAYALNKELLPQEKNCYIIINAKEVSNSIDDLFGKNQLIILN